MKLRRTFRVMAVALLLGIAAPAAHAANAESFIRSKHGQLTTLVVKAKTKADESKLENAFDEVLDYETLARESLRDYWDDRTPAERAEFQDVLTKLVRAAYRKSLKRIGNYEVEFRGGEKGAAGEVVRTVARNRQNAREEPVSIDYVVRESGGKWQIIDIVTEGSSLVGNYRSQFRRIIKKDGFPELLRRMKNKLDKGDVD